MKPYLFYSFFSFIFSISYSQQGDTISVVKEKNKDGWSMGAVPAIAFDSDIGFKIGAVVNFYDYGNGTFYPKYKHSLFFEYSITTKGSGIKQFLYDSEYLIPGIRITAEASHLTERALDFYGYNGYKAYYDIDFVDDSQTNDKYISRKYFRQERKLLRLRADFQGDLFSGQLRWLAGFSYYNIKTDTININLLNKGLDEDKKLPPVDGGLYGQYINWGIIPSDQVHGGNSSMVKFGVVYDSRDNEPNPMHGIWTEVLFHYAPAFLGNREYSYLKLGITHRQYFTLIRDALSFVYRIGYQDKLAGNLPSYMLPLIFNGGNSIDRDGLGGAKTVRGILRNRVVGEDYLFGNLELRWKFLNTIILNQNIYLAINTFADFGTITSFYNVDLSGVPDEYKYMFPNEKEKLHTSLGAGFHIALNQNFVVAINYGRPVDKRDGEQGLYIGLNWLF